MTSYSTITPLGLSGPCQAKVTLSLLLLSFNTTLTAGKRTKTKRGEYEEQIKMWRCEWAVGGRWDFSDGYLLCYNEKAHMWSVCRVILLMRGFARCFLHVWLPRVHVWLAPSINVLTLNLQLPAEPSPVRAPLAWVQSGVFVCVCVWICVTFCRQRQHVSHVGI